MLPYRPTQILGKLGWHALSWSLVGSAVNFGYRKPAFKGGSYTVTMIKKRKMNQPLRVPCTAVNKLDSKIVHLLSWTTNSWCSYSNDEMEVCSLLARLVASPPCHLYSGLGDRCVNTKQGILTMLDYCLFGCHAVSWCLVGSAMKFRYKKLALKGLS